MEATFVPSRISTDDSARLKRDVESNFDEVSHAVATLQLTAPNHYTVRRPEKVAQFEMVLVHSDFSKWITDQGQDAPNKLLTVYQWIIDPVPERLITAQPVNQRWVKVYDYGPEVGDNNDA